MKKLLGIIFLSLFCINFALADLDEIRFKKKYKIDNKGLAVTNNGFLDEVYLCNSSIKNCALINKHFSFIEFASLRRIQCATFKYRSNSSTPLHWCRFLR